TAGGNFTIVLAAQEAKIDPNKLKVVSFKSSGDAITALLGGHIDVVMSTIAAPLAQQRAGKMRMIAIAAPKRMGGELAKVPTWRDQGIDVVFSNWRAMVGPRGLSAAQLRYWDGVYAKLAQTPDFKASLEKNYW